MATSEAEFEPRIAGRKLRRSQLEEQKRAAIKAANSERELSLVVSRLEDFSAKVRHGLDRLDWLGMREIIHTVVRRIEIDHDSIEVVFRVPPTGGPSGGGPEPPRRGTWQHCTDGLSATRLSDRSPTDTPRAECTRSGPNFRNREVPACCRIEEKLPYWPPLEDGFYTLSNSRRENKA